MSRDYGGGRCAPRRFRADVWTRENWKVVWLQASTPAAASTDVIKLISEGKYHFMLCSDTSQGPLQGSSLTRHDPRAHTRSETHTRKNVWGEAQFLQPPLVSVCLSVNLSVYLSVCLSIYLFIYLSIYPSIHPSIYPSIHIYFIPVLDPQSELSF